jgi:beta-mannanase
VATARPKVSAPRPLGKLVPPSGALLGAFVSSTGTGWAAADVTARETHLGRTFDIDHRFQNWTTPFPTLADGWDIQSGRIPMVTWQPNTTTLDAINAGNSDDLVRARARDTAAFGQPIFLRFAHEMNADFYPWGGVNNNNTGRHDGPSKYIAAWRRVHDLFVAAGATNAVWVWCPNRSSIPNVAWNRAQNYYPGDAYVDWVCIDGYNRDATKWRSFTTLFSAIYATYGGRKPIMIGETSSVEGNAGRKAAWINDAGAVIQQRFPSVAAFVWFDTQKNGFDFRIDSSESSLQAFRSLGQNPYFRTRP